MELKSFNFDEMPMPIEDLGKPDTVEHYYIEVAAMPMSGNMIILGLTITDNDIYLKFNGEYTHYNTKEEALEACRFASKKIEEKHKIIKINVNGIDCDLTVLGYALTKSTKESYWIKY